MSFILFNGQEICILTMKLNNQPDSVEAERAFSACGPLVTTPQSMHCASYECVAKAVNVKNACFSANMQSICRAGFNQIWPVGSNKSRATPTNLYKLAACVVQGRGLQCVGSVANENQNKLRGF